MGRMRNSYKILVRQPEGKTPYGRRIRRWKDINKLDLKGVVCDDVDWIHLTLDRDQRVALTNTVINLRVPKKT
jgi:hypothetical protein